MCILPLVERELRAATRRPLVYWARVLAAAKAVLLGYILLRGLQNWQGGGLVGRHLFHLLCEVAFVVALAVRCITTAGSICEEGVRKLVLWANLVSLVLDLRAMAWSGLWLGLRSSTTTKAFRRAVYRVVMKPSALFWTTLPIAPILWVFGVLMPSPVGWIIGGTVWWMVFGIASSYYMAVSAKRKLDEGFRRAAAIRFGT
jgi:hypothetical protein